LYYKGTVYEIIAIIENIFEEANLPDSATQTAAMTAEAYIDRRALTNASENDLV